MKDLIIWLLLAEAIPSSYFGLVKRLVNVCPRLDAIKRSVCIEGAEWPSLESIYSGEDGRREACDRGTTRGQGAPHARAVF